MDKTCTMRKRVTALLLCAALLLCCFLPAWAEETPATPTDLSEAEPSGQTEVPDGDDMPAEPAGETPEFPDEGLNRLAEPEDLVAAFVTRCYWLVLGRQPEAEGLQSWTELLKARQLTAAQLIASFLNSAEFQGKHKPAEDLVEILYRTMLNRSSDEGGRRAWLKAIADGANMNSLINGFSQSQEFKNLCAAYGIESGTVAADNSGELAAFGGKIVSFVTRCYRVALGREPDGQGLKDWCGALTAKKTTYRAVAEGFVFSDELTNRNLNNEDFVKTLYRLYLDREADPGGLQAWSGLLDGGMARQEVSAGFANSVEFGRLIASFDPAGALEPEYTFILSPGDSGITVKNGARVTVQPSPGMDAPSELAWASSDEQIFTVTQGGEIFGVYPGQAVLTVTRPDGSMLAQLTVTVNANYRAVLFSESTFVGGVIKRNRGDVKLMQNMLASVSGPDDGKYNVFSFDDLLAHEVLANVEELLVAPSRDGDVSMFFFASHGDYRSKSPELAGRLYCRNKETWVTLPELAALLSRCKGKVIVLLESCGPGAALQEFNTAPEGGAEDEAEEAATEEAYDKVFLEAAVRAFEAADPGIRVYRPAPVETVLNAGGEQGVLGSNLFLTEKFILMVASGYLKPSYSIGTDTSNLFPNKLCKGVGTSGAMPADVECGNSDGLLTVDELFRYVYKYTSYKQVPQVYPQNCEYILFKR